MIGHEHAGCNEAPVALLVGARERTGIEERVGPLFIDFVYDILEVLREIPVAPADRALRCVHQATPVADGEVVSPRAFVGGAIE